MFNRVRSEWIALAAVILILLIGAQRCQSVKEGRWQERADSALVFAASESARADSLARRAVAAERQAELWAEHAQERTNRVRERIIEVERVVVPDTCLVFTKPRDEIIAQSDDAISAWQEAYQQQLTASALLRTSNGHLRVANDSLTAVLEDRPSPRPRWIPSVGVGVFAGACLTGPCMGAGLTLSWQVR